MNEEMRKEFEDLVVSGDLIPDLFDKDIARKIRIEMISNCFYNNRYHNDVLQSSFDAFKFGWKSSREVMKPIKLPCATFETPSGDNAFREDAVIESIQQAGYKVEA